MPGKPIRTLRGNPRDNTVEGSSADEIIYGYAGNDRLFGRGGNDTLYGGADNDTLDGGSGSDIAYGDAGLDIFIYDGGAAGDVDQFHGGDGEDWLDLRTATTAVDVTATDNNTFNLVSGSGATGSGTSVQAFWASNFGGTIDLSAITDQTGYNYVYGGSGVDVIHTSSGGGTAVYGGAGDDIIYLEAPGGFFNPSWLTGGDDYTDGGSDTVVLSVASWVDGYQGLIYTNPSVANAQWQLASFRFIDNWIGSSGDDRFDLVNSGLAPHNIQGGGGNDLVYSAGGDDTLSGDLGNDHLEGGAGSDVIYGGDGNDFLVGSGGAVGDTFNPDGGDLLVGGLGVDQMAGVGGADTFVFQSVNDSLASTPDTIHGFATGEDVIDLSGIDAVASTEEDDAFTFVGNAAFTSTAGELRISSNNAWNSQWRVEGDVDGDGFADFAILLWTNNSPAVGSDFIL